MSEETIGAIARALGNAFPFLLIGWGIAAYQKRRRRIETLPKQPIIVFGVIGVLVALTLYVQRTASPEAEVQVMRVEQPTEGATDADLTPAFVQESAEYLVAGVSKEIPEVDGTATSSVIDKDGKRLGVIRIQTGGVTPIVTVMGFKDGQLVRVTCSTTELADLDVRDPTCVRALEADFGTALDG